MLKCLLLHSALEEILPLPVPGPCPIDPPCPK